MFKSGGKPRTIGTNLNLLLLIISLPDCFCELPEISILNPRLNNFSSLSPTINSSFEGYNRVFSSFSLSWPVRFQSKLYKTLWFCNDGTLHFSRPIETFSRWESHASQYPAYIKVDSRGLAKASVQVYTTLESFIIEYASQDVTSGKGYTFHWILTYYKTDQWSPQKFDLEIVSSTLKGNAGVVRSGWFQRKIDVDNVTLVRYTGLKLAMAVGYVRTIVIGVGVAVLAFAFVAGVLCCLLKSRCCEPTRRCMKACCCECCGNWLKVSARIVRQPSEPQASTKGSLEEIENPEILSDRRLRPKSNECGLCQRPDVDIETTCLHKFHRRCLLAWYNSLGMCPKCKEPKGSHTIRCEKCRRFTIVIQPDQLIPSNEQYCSGCEASTISKPRIPSI